MPESPPLSRQSPAARPPGFDFALHVRRLCEDLVGRLPELSHIDLGRVALSFSQTRRDSIHGIYATLRPLRFAGGRTETTRRGRRWTIQRLVDGQGREMLYILTFYLPRFLNLPPHDKLVTVIHELWHISPQFDGDLRRFRGRCYAHSGSRKHYDASMERLARKYLALHPPEHVTEFLQHDFAGLLARYGMVFGQRVRPPKLIPAPWPSPPQRPTPQ